MQPRFVGRLGVADAVTVANAALGFLAAVAAIIEPGLAARLVLLAAIADGLDGVVARKLGSTPAGEYLDSLADVASFGVAPAAIVFAVVRQRWSLADPSLLTVAAFCVPALFVAMAVVRLGLYTAYDVGNEHTMGAPTTLAATVIVTAVLVGVTNPAVLLGTTALFAYLMVANVAYPDLYARDALAMGAVQALAVLAPSAFGDAFPRLLLGAALAYFLLAPRFYWRDVDLGHGTEESEVVEQPRDHGEADESGPTDDVGEADVAEEADVVEEGDVAKEAGGREVEGKRS